MEHFRRIKQSIDVRPFLQELSALPGIWESGQGRRGRWSKRREARSIPLRGPVKFQMLGEDCPRCDFQESSYTAFAERFEAVCEFLEGFAAERGAELGRIKILRLLPGQRVSPQADQGEYYRCRNRYHLVLCGGANSGFRSGGEEAVLQPGELWWLDNKASHEAYNRGTAERIHVIFDLLPAQRMAEVYGRASAA